MKFTFGVEMLVMLKQFICVALLVGAMVVHAGAAEPGAEKIQKAVTFYASFDNSLEADVAGGARRLETRFNHDKEKGKFVYEKGFDNKVFRIAKDKGIAGGALEAVDVLPRNGRVFYPLKGNLAFKKGGWGGTLSVWIKTDPDKLLKTRFCDPIQITQKGANNGGIWFDFNDAKPRDMRMGAFPAIPEGQQGIKEEDPNAPMVRVPKVGFKATDWHHIAITWTNFDTGKPDAHAILYIDGKKIGDVKDRPIAMDWDVEKAGIYVAVSYIGLLDELALFNRALTGDEVGSLQKQPGLLAGLRSSRAPGGANSSSRVSVQRLCRQLVLWPRPAPPRAPQFPFDASEARRYQEVWARYLRVPVEWTNEVGICFVLVPPGTFLMGSPEGEPGRVKAGKPYDETPQHSVTLTQPFYLSKHETTVGQFRKFVETTKHVTDGEKNGGGNAHDAKAEWKHRPGVSWRKPGYAGAYTQQDSHPVVHVSHTDALAFCKWLNDKASGLHQSGCSYDLPTEAQWEWACRAGGGTRYWWGPDEDTTGNVANVGDQTLKRVQPMWPRTIMPMDDGHAFCAPVGSYRANAFGLHDMLGNVWEFCSTRYGPYPKTSVTDPVDGDPKRGFAVRGGGWSNMAPDCRCATRNADPPHFCHSNLGFRIALRPRDR